MLVVDDHDVVHWGFRVLLGEQPWVERCVAARTGAEALALTRSLRPHVALVDLFLAGESGAELCEAIRRLAGDARAADLRRRADVAGGGPRGRGLGLRLQGLRRSRGCRRGQDGRVRNDHVRAQADQPAPLLTEREREVLDLIAAGSTNREIAERLFLSPHTVKEHTSAVYRKLHARNRADAVQRAQRIGLLG